jgi:nicotinamidase-related amidase
MNTLNYSTQTTARVLADVLNDFLADDGKLNGMIAPMLEQTALVENLTRLLHGAPAAGVKIFFAAGDYTSAIARIGRAEV